MSLLLLLSGLARAQSLEIGPYTSSNLCPGPGWVLVSDAACQSDEIRLKSQSNNRRGAAHLPQTFVLGPSTSFRMRFRSDINNDGYSGGGGGFPVFGPPPGGGGGGGGGSHQNQNTYPGGLTAVFHTAGTSEIGDGSQRGLGYENAFPSSIAIELDTVDSGSGDPSNRHLGIDDDGRVLSALQTYTTDVRNTRYTWVDYDANTHELTVWFSTQSGKPATPVMTEVVDLNAKFGTTPVRVAFTGSGSSNTGEVRVEEFYLILGDDADDDGRIADLEDDCDLDPTFPAADPDGDGFRGACDLCPTDPSLSNVDGDADGVGDACDACPDDPDPPPDRHRWRWPRRRVRSVPQRR